MLRISFAELISCNKIKSLRFARSVGCPWGPNPLRHSNEGEEGYDWAVRHGAVPVAEDDHYEYSDDQSAMSDSDVDYYLY